MYAFYEKYIKICSYKLNSIYSEIIDSQRGIVSIPTGNEAKTKQKKCKKNIRT